MFREPLRRDPLVIGWAIGLAVLALIALNANTTWSGHLEADRVAGFLRDLAAMLFLSLLVLWLLAWLRSAVTGTRRRPARAPRRPAREPFAPFPWTDRWLRDWREDAGRQGAAPAQPEAPRPVTCRHGRPVDAPVPADQAPVLCALAVNHPVVRPGSSVSVTWCFEHATDVDVDGRPGHPACGEALVQVDASRRIEVVGRNEHATTRVATATVVAQDVPTVHLPTVTAPPPVSLHTDVLATVGAPSGVTRRLDEFWATQEELRPRLSAPPPLVGVPTSVIDGLRRVRRGNGES
ncbi:hypothetical protein [Modestobacter sp. NPDC049651]|uniref:hypothetical protein n=1 Tax=unclassified Modestobacter TaxID=2643866 RepID=UPI0033EDC51F